MTQLSPQRTVGDLVIEQPNRSRVFSKLGIDFCCGGKKSLQEACREKDLDPAVVLALLTEAPPQLRSEWADAPLPALVDHILATHHQFTKAELPRLGQMLQKVARVHGEKFPYMVEVLAVFERFADEMLVHMRKEEHALFPAIKERATGRPIDLSMPITVMGRDHDGAGKDLARMRELAKEYEPPVGACNTFRAVLAGLAELEADLHEHVHLENNVLFRRVSSAS